MLDLAVLAPDPRFGGGGRKLTEAFLRASSELGRSPELLAAAHPTFDGRRLTLDRVEALRQLLSAWRLAPQAAAARELWVVSPSALDGYAAVRSGRPFRCWIGTSLADEWRARREGLAPSRRLALAVNAPFLVRLERSVLNAAAAVYAISPHSRAALAEAGGLDVGRVGILPIPVDADLLVTQRAPAPEPVVVFVGRASDPRKNVQALIEAFARVRTRLPAAKLRLVGDPPADPVPPGVEVVGRVPDVGAELRRAWLFVLPSLQEGFGIAAAEALACGTPVLTTPSGGPEDLVRASGGGRVLDGFGAGELAEAAIALLSDPDRLAEMGRRGRTHVEREHSPARFRELLSAALA